jgi:hypothetical protein
LSVQDVVERSRDKSNMLQGFGDAVLRAETLEEQLVKSRKHAAAMQSKLDTAFAKYHNDIQDAGEERRLGAEEQVAPQQEQRYTTCLVEYLLEVEG